MLPCGTPQLRVPADDSLPLTLHRNVNFEKVCHLLHLGVISCSSGASDSFFPPLCICYPLLFLLPRLGLYPTEEQIVQHELKKNKHADLDWNLSVTLTLTSVGAKLKSTLLRRSLPQFSHSLKMT